MTAPFGGRSGGAKGPHFPGLACDARCAARSRQTCEQTHSREIHSSTRPVAKSRRQRRTSCHQRRRNASRKNLQSRGRDDETRPASRTSAAPRPHMRAPIRGSLSQGPPGRATQSRSRPGWPPLRGPRAGGTPRARWRPWRSGPHATGAPRGNSPRIWTPILVSVTLAALAAMARGGDAAGSGDVEMGGERAPGEAHGAAAAARGGSGAAEAGACYAADSSSPPPVRPARARPRTRRHAPRTLHGCQPLRLWLPAIRPRPSRRQGTTAAPPHRGVWRLIGDNRVHTPSSVGRRRDGGHGARVHARLGAKRHVTATGRIWTPPNCARFAHRSAHPDACRGGLWPPGLQGERLRRRTCWSRLRRN